jgi:hypothetical protein
LFPANTVDGIDDFLRGRHSQLIGILFAHKNMKLTKEEILSMLKSYHLRSAEFIHFFLPGYLSKGELENYSNTYPDAEDIGITINGVKWFFSEKAFDSICRTLKEKSKSKWEWCGVPELLLLDAGQNIGGIDLSSVIDINLDKERENKRIDNLSTFFGKIFNYAEENRGQTSVYDFSDSQVPSIVGSVARKFAEKMVTQEISTGIRNLEILAVRNFC